MAALSLGPLRCYDPEKERLIGSQQQHSLVAFLGSSVGKRAVLPYLLPGSKWDLHTSTEMLIKVLHARLYTRSCILYQLLLVLLLQVGIVWHRHQVHSRSQRANHLVTQKGQGPIAFKPICCLNKRHPSIHNHCYL